MNSIDRYKNQHKIILSLCTALEESAALSVVEKKISYFHSVLNTLDDVLGKHLESEDAHLYPRCSQGSCPDIRNIAQKLQKEMLPITDVYASYKKKYFTKKNVFSDTDFFLKETKAFVLSLENRINKEENELYSRI